MARGGHGIPKVLLRPAMPYHSILCGWATPDFSGVACLEVGWLVAISYPFGRPTLYAYGQTFLFTFEELHHG
jgi:hypothetical protein